MHKSLELAYEINNWIMNDPEVTIYTIAQHYKIAENRVIELIWLTELSEQYKVMLNEGSITEYEAIQLAKESDES